MSQNMRMYFRMMLYWTTTLHSSSWWNVSCTG